MTTNMTATAREVRAWLSSLAVLLAVYVAWPRLDLAVSRWFYRPDQGFWMADQPWVIAVHHTVPWLGRILLLVALLLWVLAWLSRRTAWRRWRRPAGALALCMVLGLGLLVHAVLKEHWGRARPVQVEAFGGTAVYTPPWQPSTACSRNCSFVSGHAGTGFVLMAVGTLAACRRRLRWLAVGWGAGLALGTLRVVQGGHFLSDVLFCGVLLWGVSLAIRWAWLRARLWHRNRRRPVAFKESQ